MSTNGPVGNNEDSKISHKNEQLLKNIKNLAFNLSTGFISRKDGIIFMLVCH